MRMNRKENTLKTDFLDRAKDNSYWDWFNPIPYVKEFRRLKLVNSVNACLVMGKLEMDFKKNPKHFCRYITPCPFQDKLGGLSWTEELGINNCQFRAAFDEIGVRYRTIKLFNNTKDKFKGKYYCSVLDSLDDNKTSYYRNDELVNSHLKRLSEIVRYEGMFNTELKLVKWESLTLVQNN